MKAAIILNEQYELHSDRHVRPAASISRFRNWIDELSTDSEITKFDGTGVIQENVRGLDVWNIETTQRI